MKVAVRTVLVLAVLCHVAVSVVGTDDGEFAGRRIVLLGASQGMGRSAGELMVQRGAQVVFLSRSQDKIDKLLEDMGNPEGAYGLTCDAGDVGDIKKALEKSNQLMGGIDGFMYGPTCVMPEGFMGVLPLMEAGKFKEVHDCQQKFNVINFIESVNLVVPYMKENGGGSIVTISSIMGQIPSNSAPYSAAKATADVYVRSLSLTLARSNIRINSFAAGAHFTTVFQSIGEAGIQMAQDLSWRIPMGRMGTAKEGGEMIAFMLSDRASYMTGEVLASDGGTLNLKSLSEVGLPEEERLMQSSPQNQEYCKAQL